MVYEIIPISLGVWPPISYNPLYQTTNQGFEHCSVKKNAKGIIFPRIGVLQSNMLNKEESAGKAWNKWNFHTHRIHGTNGMFAYIYYKNQPFM